MTTTNAAISLGTPAEMAKRIAWQPVALTTTSASQSSAGGLMKGKGNQLASVTFASAAQAVTLPADAEIGDEIIVSNVTANAGVIFPPSGGNINGNTADTSVAITAQGSASSSWRFLKLNATRWIGSTFADAT